MTSAEMLSRAEEFEAQALVLVEHMHGGFDRHLMTEAAELFAIAAGLREASGWSPSGG